MPSWQRDAHGAAARIGSFWLIVQFDGRWSWVMTDSNGRDGFAIASGLASNLGDGIRKSSVAAQEILVIALRDIGTIE